MKALVIDTTTADLVVAVVEQDNVIDYTLPCAGTRHSEMLCLTVQKLLDEHNLTFQDFDCYAVSIGPGSFTGIRIGVATVKGYATACPKPLIAVNTLQAIACSCNLGNKGCAVIDAGNGWYFADYVNNLPPQLIAYDDSRVNSCATAKLATEYFDGLVKIVRDCYNNGNYSYTLTPLYIRRSQAEEQHK